MTRIFILFFVCFSQCIVAQQYIDTEEIVSGSFRFPIKETVICNLAGKEIKDINLNDKFEIKEFINYFGGMASLEKANHRIRFYNFLKLEWGGETVFAISYSILQRNSVIENLVYLSNPDALIGPILDILVRLDSNELKERFSEMSSSDTYGYIDPFELVKVLNGK